jgi:glycosyltransferase involved in cell wall biosynthesis
MKNILALVSYYLPGYKSGGPVRSLSNLVEEVKDRFNFHIVTRDRDFGESQAYNNIRLGEWNEVGGARVFYCTPHQLTLLGLRRVISSVKYDVLYINGFFNPVFSIRAILLRRNRLIRRGPCIVAPQGEFSPGAFETRWVRKQAYVKLSRAIGTYGDVSWQASSSMERGDIQKHFGAEADIHLCADSVSPGLLSKKLEPPEKRPGKLKVVYISRIVPKKNLYGAIQLLSSLRGEVEFKIYGAIDDRSYWDKCQERIRSVPSSISVSYEGVVDHEEVVTMFSRSHVFLFPTFGENFGHVVLEALVAGCVPLVGDATPWQVIEKQRLGWTISVSQPDLWVSRLNQCLNMDQVAMDSYSNRCRSYARLLIANGGAAAAFEAMCEKADEQFRRRVSDG